MSTAIPTGTSGPTNSRTRRETSPSTSGYSSETAAPWFARSTPSHGPFSPQHVDHLADDAIERVLRNRAYGPRSGVDEGHALETQVAGRLQEPLRCGFRTTELVNDLLAPQDAFSLETCVIGRDRRERVRLVRYSQDREPHDLPSQTCPNSLSQLPPITLRIVSSSRPRSLRPAGMFSNCFVPSRPCRCR